MSTQQHWGGGESLLLSIGQELQRAAHAVSWIARDASAVAERLDTRQQSILHRLRRRGVNWHDWRGVVHSLKTWVPDVVILNDTHAVPLVGAACWFGRRPRPLRLAYKHTIFPLRSKLKYRLLSDGMICVSSAARDTLLRGGMPAERCRVIYGGCHPPQSDAGHAADVRRELGLDHGARLLVCVGSLLDCKGHADLIEALPAVLRLYPDVRLIIAGDGDQRTKLQQRIEQLQLQPHARLLGYRDDADRLLAAADLVVHPSHAEGLSLVLIQAQMLEKPIVATAVGGTVEVLQSTEPEQCSSWIAEPRDPAHLAVQLAAALAATSQPSAELVLKLAHSAVRARRLFDIRIHAEELAEHCAQLLRD